MTWLQKCKSIFTELNSLHNSEAYRCIVPFTKHRTFEIIGVQNRTKTCIPNGICLVFYEKRPY